MLRHSEPYKEVVYSYGWIDNILVNNSSVVDVIYSSVCTIKTVEK